MFLLEQKWEQIFELDDIDHGNVVMDDAVVKREVVLVRQGGREKKVVDIIWSKSPTNQGELSVGLSLDIVERMEREEKTV